jgi:hypothetical protein
MRLSLMLRETDHSYSKRNIVLGHSSPSPHLTKRVYEPRKRSPEDKENEDLPKLEEHKVNFSTSLKHYRSFWNKVKDQLKRNNGKLD